MCTFEKSVRFNEAWSSKRFINHFFQGATMKTRACIMGVLFVFLSAVYGDNTSATQSLIQACKANQIFQIQKYIQEGADVNAANAQGILPLYYAVRNANSQAVELLIDHGAKVDLYSAGEGAEFKDVTMPVLMWAASMKKNGMVSLLVSRGVSLEIGDSNSRHLDCLAVESNNTELLDLIVEKGGQFNSFYLFRRGASGSLLHLAIEDDNIPMLSYLLEKNVDPEIRDHLGRSALIAAVEANNLEMVKLLVAKGAYLYATPGYGGTLLERDTGLITPMMLNFLRKSDREARESVKAAPWAAFVSKRDDDYYLDWDRFADYVSQGGDMHGVDSERNTPLHYAARFRQEWLEKLIAAGLDVNAVNIHGETPLHLAAADDNVEQVRILLEHGADVNIRDKTGNTPLITLSRNCSSNRGIEQELTIVRMLLDRGADINARNYFGATALIKLSELNMDRREDLIRLLIERGSAIDRFDGKFQTALHRAADMGTPKTVKMLLEAGASVDIRDIYGCNPLDVARYDREEKLALLFPYKKDACIIEAVFYDQLDDIERLVKADDGGVEHVHSDWNNGATSLILAAQKGSLKLVEKLIELKANVNAQDTLGNTALHYAAQKDKNDIVAALLRAGASVTCKNRTGKTPVDLAVAEKHLRTERLLREFSSAEGQAGAKGSPDEKKSLLKPLPPVPDTAAMEEARQRGIEKRQDYIQMLASSSDRPFHQAVIMGKLDFAKTLIDKDKSIVGKPDGMGVLPVTCAAMTGNKEMVSLLLENGADINQLDENATFYRQTGVVAGHTYGFKTGWGALHYLASTDDIDMVEYMVSKGADINICDIEHQMSPLWIAFKAGNREMMKALISLGANLEQTNNEGKTLITRAAEYGKNEEIDQLLSFGANIDTRDKGGRAPLHGACMFGKHDTVLHLIERGADVKAVDSNGNNGLHHTVSYEGGSETVRVLIEHGVDVNQKNSSGQVPWFLLRRPGHDVESGVIDNLKLVLQAGADISVRNNSGDSLLHIAADLGSVEIGKLAVQYGADVNWVNNKGQSPLNRCVTFSFDKIKQQSPELIDFLIAQGADVNLADAQKKTPLHNAASRGDASIIQRLIDSGAQCDCKDALGKIPADYIPSDKKDQLLPLFEKKTK